MRQTIEALQNEVINIEAQRSTLNVIGLDHGSQDQTRAIALSSIYSSAIDSINAALSQLRILEYHLY